MSETNLKTISLLYNAMISTTANRNVIRQGGISAMVSSYSYNEIQLDENTTYDISCNNMVLISTDTPLVLKDASGNVVFTISNFFVLEGSLLNFVLYNSTSSTANVIILTC